MQEKEIIMNEKLAHNNTDELKDKMEENLIKHQIANNKTIEPVVDEARRESKENANIIPTRRNSSATETQKILKRIAKSPTKKYKGTKVNIVKNLEKPIQPPMPPPTTSIVIDSIKPTQKRISNKSPNSRSPSKPIIVNNKNLTFRNKTFSSKSLVEFEKPIIGAPIKTSSAKFKPTDQKLEQNSAYIVKVLEQKYKVTKEDSFAKMTMRQKENKVFDKPLQIDYGYVSPCVKRQINSNNIEKFYKESKFVRINIAKNVEDNFFEQTYNETIDDEENDGIYDPDNYNDSARSESVLIETKQGKNNINSEMQTLYDKKLGLLSINNSEQARISIDIEKKNSSSKDAQLKSVVNKTIHGQLVSENEKTKKKEKFDVTILVEKKQEAKPKTTNSKKLLKATPRFNIAKSRSYEEIRRPIATKKAAKKSLSNLEATSINKKNRADLDKTGQEMPEYKKVVKHHHDESGAKSSNISVLTNQSFDIPNILDSNIDSEYYDDERSKKLISFIFKFQTCFFFFQVTKQQQLRLNLSSPTPSNKKVKVVKELSLSFDNYEKLIAPKKVPRILAKIGQYSDRNERTKPKKIKKKGFLINDYQPVSTSICTLHLA